MPDERQVLLSYVDEVCSKIAAKVARDLRKSKTTLSGEDSGLTNAWEEICVQRQTEVSISWEAYDSTVRQHVLQRLNDVPRTLQIVAWFTLDTHGAEDSSEFNEEDLVEHIAGVVYKLADSYSNKRIDRYLSGRDG